MATKSPVFPMPEPHHFSDYGFDPQFDYFQVLEEAKRYKQSTTKSTDTFHFNLHKPLSIDKKDHRRRRWWKSALFFFKSRWGAHPSSSTTTTTTKPVVLRPTSLSGPIYITDSLSGSPTPFYRPSSSSGPLDTPYFSLRELNMDLHPHRISSRSPLPIYLVT